MNKTVKRILIAVLVTAGVIGGAWGVMAGIRAARKTAVKVYPVEQFVTSYWGDTSESYGLVHMDNMQKIYLSETQTVNEVFVKEGDTVKKGDRLMSYDTTLTDIALKKDQIALEKMELEKKTAEGELNSLRNAASREYLESRYNTLQKQLDAAWEKLYEEQGKPVELPVGEGTAASPLYVERSEGAVYRPADLLADRNELWLVLVTNEGGNYTGYTGLHFMKYAESDSNAGVMPAPDPEEPDTPDEPDVPDEPDTPDEPDVPDEPDTPDEPDKPDEPDTPDEPVTPDEPDVPDEPTGKTAWSVSLFTPQELDSPVIEETDEIKSLQKQADRIMDLLSTAYSRAEIIEMTAETEKRISELELDIRIAKVDLAMKEKEAGDGIVLCEFDGVVKAVRDPKEAFMNNEAVVEVSGGGGYYVTCYVSELELDTIYPGQPVTVMSYEDGSTYEGVIREIDDYPASQADAWTSGNNNVSWYPFRVFIGEEASLREYSYVGVSYQKVSDSTDTAWYLQKFFIRSDNGKHYVFVEGPDGTLEKRTVQTGKDLWGDFLEIRGGLTQEDYVAFPYGQDVTEGAETVRAEASDLYGG